MSTRPTSSILKRSGDFSTPDKKTETPRTEELRRVSELRKVIESPYDMILKASDVAKVPEPMMEKHHKTPFCVENQLIESKQE